MPITSVNDTGNQFGWASRSNTFDDEGVLHSSTVIYDNGVTHTDTYAYGYVMSSATYDVLEVGGVYSWIERSNVFDFSTYIRTLTTIYDDGILSVEQIDNGLVELTLTDTENVENWSTIESFYQDGFLDKIVYIYYDDLTVMRSIYGWDGQVTSRIKFDEGDLNSWTTFAQSFDQTGQVEVASFENDNGLSQSTTYRDGVRNWSDESDGLDVRNWESRETYYDPNGVRVAKVTTYDDGIVQAEEWLGGNRSVTNMDDTLDVAGWKSIRTFYDVNGVRVAKVTTMDDGVVKEEEWADSNRSATRLEDTLNANSWESIHTYYDPNGVQVAKVTTNDNGFVKTEEWSGGNRTLIQQADTLNIKNWDSVATYYDQTGTISGRLTVMDNGVESLRCSLTMAPARLLFPKILRMFMRGAQKRPSMPQMGQWASVISTWTTVTALFFAYQLDDGQIDFRLEVDGNNSDPWAYRVTEYDIDGLNPVVTTYDSTNELPQTYIDYLGYVLVA